MYYTYGTYSYLHNSIGKQYIEHNGLSHLNFWLIYYAPEGRGRI